MKAKMLKLAGVKSEKEFYKKFPTEEAFMKVHGKAFKKAQLGDVIGGGDTRPLIENYPDYNSWRAADQAWQMSGGSDTSNQSSPQINNTTTLQEFEGLTGMGDTQQMSSKMLNIGKLAGQAAGKGVVKGAGAGKKGPSKLMGALEKAAPGAGQLIQGVSMIKQQKNALKSAQQMQALSDLTLQATRLKPEQQERRYVRPEDSIVTGQELFPIYGTGTNPLAKNGAEIANTFAPNTLYDDLGYEPLYDSERVKQFFTGGKMTADFGAILEDVAEAGGGNFGSQAITSIAGESAGGSIGGGIGKMAGTAIGGPVGGMIGEVGGKLIGSLIDKTPGKIKRAQAATDQNIMTAAMNKGFQGAQKQYTSFMEHGGNVNPQIISKFGDYSLEELLAADPTMDTLRAGGHLKEYTEPSARALQTYEEGGLIPEMEEGGELQTHWGGYAEPMSRNPYLPDSGETIMFRGQSHDESDGQGNTGIGITYGQNPVEVERGEPAVKLRDGGGDESLVVFGNLKVPSAFVPILGEEAKGKKFKNYVADLSKKENKQNKIIDKSSKGLDDLDMNTPFDKLTMGSYKANILGANMKLKDIAAKKMDASALQNAMNTAIEMFDMEADDNGVVKAENGITIGDKEITRLKKMYDVAKKKQTGPAVTAFQKEMHKLAPDVAKEVLSKYDITKKGKDKGLKKTDLESNVDEYFGPRTKEYMTAFENKYVKKAPTLNDTFTGNLNIAPEDIMTGSSEVTVTSTKKAKPETEDKKKGKFPLMDLFNQALPYLRPTDAGRLDPMETVGEMYAMSQNQLEPVQAQLFQPELNVPYDVSLQDILNENQADFRSQQRMVGYNPAVQGMLNAQKYAANQKVLGEQFRMNQAQKQQVYDQNRATLNQTRAQNLGILDQQYTRQAGAKSATKATTQAALNSIAAKYAQNKLANRTLQTYENLYNFRFDPAMRAINMNPLVDFQAMIDNASSGQLDTMLKSLQEKTAKTSKKKTEESEKSKRNGSIVKALKSL